MKKFLMVIAVCAFPMMTLTGCGGSSGTSEVGASQESDGSMSTADQEQYEQQMQSGGGGSSRPGN